MIGRLHILVDSYELAQQALQGGADCLQIRIKDIDDASRLVISQRISELCTKNNAQCIINDRADIAVATGAIGVHLGSQDLPIKTVRKLFGPELVIGATARTTQEALALQADGASYVGVGPVYATTSKTGLPDPIGLHALESAVNAVDIPVIAIGGINLQRLPEVLATNAHGIAVISAVANATDPVATTQAFQNALTTHV